MKFFLVLLFGLIGTLIKSLPIGLLVSLVTYFVFCIMEIIGNYIEDNSDFDFPELSMYPVEEKT